MPKLHPANVPSRRGSNYPAPFAELAAGRIKQALGKAAGLTDFGVNLTRLPPGTWSSQRHWHSKEDEFVYVLEGELTLVTDDGEALLHAGDCAGFAKNIANGHHLINRNDIDALYLEVGARSDDDVCQYPDIDLRASNVGYTHTDGSPYPKPG